MKKMKKTDDKNLRDEIWMGLKELKLKNIKKIIKMIKKTMKIFLKKTLS